MMDARVVISMLTRGRESTRVAVPTLTSGMSLDINHGDRILTFVESETPRPGPDEEGKEAGGWTVRPWQSPGSTFLLERDSRAWLVTVNRWVLDSVAASTLLTCLIPACVSLLWLTLMPSWTALFASLVLGSLVLSSIAMAKEHRWAGYLWGTVVSIAGVALLSLALRSLIRRDLGFLTEEIGAGGWIAYGILGLVGSLGILTGGISIIRRQRAIDSGMHLYLERVPRAS